MPLLVIVAGDFNTPTSTGIRHPRHLRLRQLRSPKPSARKGSGKRADDADGRPMPTGRAPSRYTPRPGVSSQNDYGLPRPACSGRPCIAHRPQQLPAAPWPMTTFMSRGLRPRALAHPLGVCTVPPPGLPPQLPPQVPIQPLGDPTGTTRGARGARARPRWLGAAGHSRSRRCTLHTPKEAHNVPVHQDHARRSASPCPERPRWRPSLRAAWGARRVERQSFTSKRDGDGR